MRRWRVYHFHDTSDTARVKKASRLADNLTLQSDAANLAAFLHRIKDQQSYPAIIANIRRVAPFFHDFILEPEGENIRLRWKHVGTDDYFDATDLSDGTLRFICLATLFLQPNPPLTILLDEPELGLHPYALEVLASIIRSVSSRKNTSIQVIASTQSVTLANQFNYDDLIIVDRDASATTLRRLSEAEVKDWLGDYALGELWEKNLIGGVPA